MRKVLTSIFLLFNLSLIAQSFAPSASQIALVKKASNDFTNGRWLCAIKEYEKAIDLNSGTTSLDGATMAEATLRMSKCYEMQGDRKKAAIWLEKAKAYNPQNKELIFSYARSLQAANRDADALKAFEEYVQKGGDANKAKPFMEVVNKRALGNYVLKGAEAKSLKLRGELSCYSPVFYGNNLAFTSPAKKEPRKDKSNKCKAYRTNLYQAKQKMNGDFATPEGFCSCVNSKKFNEGPATFNKDNSVIYFTRQIDVKNKEGKTEKKLSIFQMNMACEKNSSLKPLSFTNKESNFAYAAINQTGNVMYFASDMPGGQGGLDLYKVTMTDSTFGKVENLGATINTAQDETAPFVSADGKLYFASNGHPGIGGFDIFTSEADASGKYARVSNLKEPVNSSAEDIGFAIHPQLGSYFSSNRNGEFDVFKMNTSNFGQQSWEFKVLDAATNTPLADAQVDLVSTGVKKGEVSFTATDGKVVFENVLPANYSLSVEKVGYAKATQVVDGTNGKAVTLDVKLNAEKGLKGTVVNTTDKTPIANAEVQWLAEGGKSGLVTYSEANGQYGFDKNGPANGMVVASAKGFKDLSISLKDVLAKNASIELAPEGPVVASPTPVALDLTPIGFNTGKHNLKIAELPKLNKLAKYMTANLNSKLEITGCTDDLGDDKANKVVAEKRAEQVKKFLTSAGVKAENISTKTSVKLPVDVNCKGKKACVEKSRQANRKVELKLNN